MFDAFAKIDGGGAGRDANDDRRMDESEWLKGYTGVTGYGFVALADIKDDKAAKVVFGKIDENGGGKTANLHFMSLYLFLITLLR